MIVFRADGGAQTGSGHIMRCLSLAAALQRQGQPCHFVLADDAMAAAVHAAGFAATVLGTDPRAMTAELPALLPVLQQQSPAWVVADSYCLTPAWLAAVRVLCPVARFCDDAGEAESKPGPGLAADLLINYNLFALDAPAPAGPALLGPAYAPLRAQFCGLPRRTAAAGVQNVLVSTGGADPQNVAGQLLAALAAPGQADRWQGVCFHFVVGALNPHLPELQRTAAGLPFVKLHSNVQNMAELMQRCDIAIAAAGSTLYELCACGTPTITYVLADNQRPGAAAFAARGLMLDAGDCRLADPPTGPDFCTHLLAQLADLAADAPRRAAMAAAMQALVDGHGAERTARFLKKAGQKL